MLVCGQPTIALHETNIRQPDKKSVRLRMYINLDIIIYETIFYVQYKYTNNIAGKQIVITMT